MSAMDPCQTVYEALERGGYDPHGPAYNATARCPGHDGDGHNLHLSIGADGRALLHCHAHECSLEAILAPLGLALPDLFPAGHRHARRRRLREARLAEFAGQERVLANTLRALAEIGAPWDASLQLDCPLCGAPGALLHVSSRATWLSCPGDEDGESLGFQPGACTLDAALQALAGRVDDRNREEAR